MTISSEFGHDASLVCLWRENPNRLVSLWDIMREFSVLGLLLSLFNIDLLDRKCTKIIDREHGGVSVPESDLHYARTFLPMALEFCKNAAFSRSAELIEGLIETIDVHDASAAAFTDTRGIDASTFATTLEHIRSALDSDIKAHSYFQVLSPKIGYLEPALFGATVSRMISDASGDIQRAGTCMAVEGLDTAAVFHLMRTAEFGLRKIAKVLRVKLTHSGRAQPIESADWDKVITGIKNKIANARTSLPKGSKRDQQLEVYSDLADHCLFMKDIWRNSVSHARKEYISSEALAVFERTRDFMTALASALDKKSVA